MRSHIRREQSLHNNVSPKRQPPTLFLETAMQEDIYREIKPRLIRKAAVLQMCDINNRHLDRLVSKGEFPQPILIDAKHPRWAVDQVEDWLDNVIAAGGIPSAIERYQETLESRKRGAHIANERKLNSDK